MNTEERINEFTKRQVAYSSSLVAKLNKVDGEFFYTVSAWLDRNKEETKFTVIVGKYNNEDPDDLFNLARKALNVRKIKVGVPI